MKKREFVFLDFYHDILAEYDDNRDDIDQIKFDNT